MTRVLIEHDADINERYCIYGGCRTFEGCTTLHMAVSTASAEIVEALVEKGMDVEARDRRLRTPLHYTVEAAAWRTLSTSWASWARTVVVLLRNHADPDAKDAWGSTPSSMAINCKN